MDIRYKQLVKGMLLFGGLVLAAPSGFSQGLTNTTLDCSSENYKRTVCSAGAPIERIRLIEKKSGAACTQGSTFGYSGDSVWVDRGCAGKFEVTVRDTNYNDRQSRRGQTEVASLRCSSERFGRTNCSVEGTVRSVDLIRQRSQARCEKGVSFGYSGNSIWVDKGCDADFEVRFVQRYARQGNRTVRFACKSNQFNLGVCYVAGPIVDLRMVQKKSRAACDRNESYGFQEDAIWVKRGCEAEFEVTYRPGRSAGWEFNNSGPQTQSLTCKSDQFRRQTCNAGGIISDIRLVKTRSRAACKANSSYGFNFDEIWVTNGCEGDFEVVYYPRP